MASKPTKKDQVYLNPEWLAKTAKLAGKRGTALVFSKTGVVYGILPKSSGSVNVFYDASGADGRDWVEAVLAAYPNGAVFPFDNMFGGPATAKALRAYGNIRLPEDGTGKAWIDPLTNVLYVKGKGATIHSASFAANDTPAPSPRTEIPGLSFAEDVVKEIGKLLVETTRRDDNRPFLKRVYGYTNARGSYLGSTDGRSAVMHKIEGELPEGFSFDPTLVNMYDIVGYRRDETETGAEIHTFRLSDDTVFVEKLAGIEPPEIPKMIDGTGARTKQILLSSAATRKLAEDVAELGLGSNDAWGGVLKFTPAGVEMLSGNQPVAEFDASTSLAEGMQVSFAVPLVDRFATLGGDLQLTTGGKIIGYAVNAATRIIAMPMLVGSAVPAAPESGATA